MLLKGNQRGGGKQMALHLLNEEVNEHVEVHEVRGFISQDVMGALNEAYAVSKATKCKQFLFSVSLNPPPDANVDNATFEDAIERLEKKLSLNDQPRVIVFHEKEGRRHAHCVWSRIDTDEMKAVNMSLYKRKMNEVAKEIFLEQKWDMPGGFINKDQTNPLNFTKEEWAQAQRTGQHAKQIKSALQESWSISDNKQAFEAAIQDRGYYLARGDKRGYVAIDLYGEVYSLSRKLNVNKTELEDRLGKTDKLRSVDQTKEHISGLLSDQFLKYHEELKLRHSQEKEKLTQERKKLTLEHREIRKQQLITQKKRWELEEKARSERIRKGFKGLWDRLTGTYQRTRRKNEIETQKAFERDKKQRFELVSAQMEKRKSMQDRFNTMRNKQHSERMDFLKGVNRHYTNIEKQASIRKIFEEERHKLSIKQNQGISHDPEI